MPTERKNETIATLTELLSGSRLAIQTEYRGMTVKEVENLRVELRKHGVQYRIVKNTLGRIAARRAGVETLADLLTGPSALVLGGDDPVAPAKALDTWMKANPRSVLKVTGGVLENRVLTPEQVTALANLPSREELIAKLMGSLNSPVTGLVTVLNGPLRGLLTVLNARAQQLGG